MSGDGPRSGCAAAGGVRLHYLDWGGDGEPLVLFPGLGQSAHVFRDLAPALADRMRVLALTPRAHGESDAPGGGYHVQALADDVGGFLDALGIGAASIVAHSFSGAVATRFAADHPGRVARLAYVDALTDFSTMGRVQFRNAVRPPPPPHDDDPEGEREWLRRYHYGAWTDAIEADYRVRPAGGEAVRRHDLLAHLLDDAAGRPPPYALLRCPVLALVAGESVETQYGWLDAEDHGRRALARDYLDHVRGPWRRGAVERFRREAPHARVVTIPGHHFLFLSSRDAVVRELRAFLLPSPVRPD
jgi:pimeloyl-ACP methyl ester carboxylesterase